ncbi:hypothetical protein ABIF68_007824 [Bradyrhizobium japonicum]
MRHTNHFPQETLMSIISEPEFRYNMLIKAFPSRAEPAFETESEQVGVLGAPLGLQQRRRPDPDGAHASPRRRVEYR